MVVTVTFFVVKVQAGDRRHPDTLPYRCYLSVLAGFERLRRAGPARTGASILEERKAVNSKPCFLQQPCFLFCQGDSLFEDLQSFIYF
jgi:hypothetical protein